MMEAFVGMLAVFGFPVVIVALGLGFAAFQRYLKHKEWMAMINQGIVPEDWQKSNKPQLQWPGNAASAVTLTLVGIAITLGLATIGIGPWLIGGLVPTAIGCGFLIARFMGESKERKSDE